jgi:hypothetical protein
MTSLELIRVYAVALLLLVAVSATTYTTYRLLTQNPDAMLPEPFIKTLWLVPGAIWSVYALLCWTT